MNTRSNILFLSVLLSTPGCMTATYTEGTAKLTITKFAWQTHIGQLEASDSNNRKLVIRDMDSTSQAIGLAQEAVKLAGSVKP